MTNLFDDEDVDIVLENYYQEVMFDKVSSRTEITCEPVTIWSYDHDITKMGFFYDISFFLSFSAFKVKFIYTVETFIYVEVFKISAACIKKQHPVVH